MSYLRLNICIIIVNGDLRRGGKRPRIRTWGRHGCTNRHSNKGPVTHQSPFCPASVGHARWGRALRILFNCRMSSVMNRGTTQLAQVSVIAKSLAGFKWDVGP